MTNPNDPLTKPTAAPDAARELFQNLSKVCSGFTAEQVIVAAINLLINAIRQNKATRDGAAQAFDEVSAHAKQMLLDQHYDLTGKRRNIFPFHQTIEIPHVAFKSKISGV
jgi:hypothetical protein